MLEPFNIDFKDLAFAILKKWYIVIFCAIGVGVGATYLGSYTGLYTTYSSKARVIVGNTIDDVGMTFNIQDIRVYQSYMSTYIAMLNTSIVMDKVEERLGEAIPIGSVKGRVSASPVEDTQFLDLSFTWYEKSEAAPILQIITETFVETMNYTYPAIRLRIMDEASEPIAIVSGSVRPKINQLGVIIGAAFSLLIIFGLEFLNETLKNDKEIERYVKTRCLATIPKQHKKLTVITPRALAKYKPSYIEGFRVLRSNLASGNEEKTLRVLALTSLKKEEGKTTTAVMLATTMACAGKRTLLIDCNFRKPMIQYYFGLENKKGFTDYIEHKVKVSEVIHQSSIEKLHILPVGTLPTEPSECLYDPRVKELLRGLREIYEYIIIDTPPMGIMADAQVLSQLTDGYIFLATYRKTKASLLLKTKEIIEYTEGNVVGIVLNKTKDHRFNRLYKAYIKQHPVKIKRDKKEHAKVTVSHKKKENPAMQDTFKGDAPHVNGNSIHV